MKNLLFIVAAGLVFGSCNSSTSAEDAVSEVVETVSTPKITVSPKAPGMDFPDATITDWGFTDGDFKFDVDASTYELGQQTADASSIMCANSGKGQHIHLIVDNKPYAAKYTPKFAYELEDGDHQILAFLSRSYHESIKTPAAHRAVNATVAGNSFTKVEPITNPMLFYSRPKGTYVGKDAQKLLLDFYPVNVQLDADHQVKVETNGETFMLDKWQPYVLEGLPMGENTVTLTLVDGEGKRIEAPHNPVSRTFSLQADPLSE
ncbi:MAG: phosphopeptide-binding protein [Saprospiraceae bacterium]